MADRRRSASRLAFLTALLCAVWATPASALQVDADYAPYRMGVAATQAAGPALGSDLASQTAWTNVDGGHRFVTVSGAAGTPRMSLTSVTRRRYAGQGVSWSCDTVGGTKTSGGTLPVRRTTPAQRLGAGRDYCLVSIAVDSSRPAGRLSGSGTVSRRDEYVQQVALTPTGRAFISRMRGAALISNALVTAGFLNNHVPATLPAAAQIVDGRPFAIVLAGPDAPAPPGRLGVWTGGGRLHLAYGTVDGKALVYDRDGTTRLVVTNALDELRLLDASRGFGTTTAAWFDSWTESTPGYDPETGGIPVKRD